VADTGQLNQGVAVGDVRTTPVGDVRTTPVGDVRTTPVGDVRTTPKPGAAKPGSAVERAAEVGARLFAAWGYSATTTRELSRALGVTNGTFYHYFATKEDLLVYICDQSLDRISEAVAAAVEQIPADQPRERIEALIRTHLVTMLSDQSLHMTGLTELRALAPENRAKVSAKRDSYAAFVRYHIDAGHAAGVLRTDLNGWILTLMLLNILNWTVFWFDSSGPMTSEEVADAMVTLYLDGASER
jgi:TetR/AcrR family transcriptional regulator, cholesterol catabolism regulator